MSNCKIAHVLIAEKSTPSFMCIIIHVTSVLEMFGSIQKSKDEESSEHLVATLKAEKEELEPSLSKEKLQTIQLKQELVEAETRNTELYKVITRYILIDLLLLYRIPEIQLSSVCFSLIRIFCGSWHIPQATF